MAQAKLAKIYDFTLPANGSFQLPVEGDYFRILTSTGDVEVVGDTFSRFGPIKAGQGLEKAPYRRLTINDKSGSANIGTIIVASDGFVDQRVVGEVSVIDGGKARTLAGNAFSGMVAAGAVAAQFAHVQLWNPTTTKNSVVEQIVVSSTTSVSIVMRSHNAALPSAYGAQPNPASKKIGGADSAMQSFFTNNAAAVPTGKYYGLLAVNANQISVFRLAEPIVIPPSQGLVLYVSNAVNTDLSAIFENYEDPV